MSKLVWKVKIEARFKALSEIGTEMRKDPKLEGASDALLQALNWLRSTLDYLERPDGDYPQL